MALNVMNAALSIAWFTTAFLKMFGVGIARDIPFGAVLAIIGIVFLWGIFEDPDDRLRSLAHTYVGGTLSVWMAIFSVTHITFGRFPSADVYFEIGMGVLAVLSYLVALRARREIENFR